MAGFPWLLGSPSPWEWHCLGSHRGHRFPKASSPWRLCPRPWHIHAAPPYAGPFQAVLLMPHRGTPFYKIFAVKQGGNPSTVSTRGPLTEPGGGGGGVRGLGGGLKVTSQAQEAGLQPEMCSGFRPLSTCLILRKFFLIRIPP